METILRHASLEPMELTYVGIGSCPHVSEGQELEPKYDQLIPKCFHELLIKDKKHMRIVHFDPAFEQYKEFLLKYFETWNLIPMDIEGGWSWVGENLEVILLPIRIDHTEHFWFFQSLCESVLETRGKLVVQEYTGHELKELNQTLYDTMENKELYKRRCLFDMTYGTDIGCCTDMTKAQPFYDYELDFINLHFMTDKDAKSWVSASLKLDQIIRKKYMYKFLNALNSIHVDYRRKLRDEGLMYDHPLYTETSSADDIMKILQQELRTYLDILVLTHTVDPEMKSVLENVFARYKEQDPYKWYEAVKKILPPP